MDPQSSATAGRVYIVGAGPGDPGLITLKGARLLAEADVVLYDDLLDTRLLDLTRPECERVYAGHRGGRVPGGSGSRQDECQKRAPFKNGQFRVFAHVFLASAHSTNT